MLLNTFSSFVHAHYSVPEISSLFYCRIRWCNSYCKCSILLRDRNFITKHRRRSSTAEYGLIFQRKVALLEHLSNNKSLSTHTLIFLEIYKLSHIRNKCLEKPNEFHVVSNALNQLAGQVGSGPDF